VPGERAPEQAAQDQTRLAEALLAWAVVPAQDGAETPAQRLRRFQCELYASVHNDTTPAQRERAAARMRGWEVDARALATRARW